MNETENKEGCGTRSYEAGKRRSNCDYITPPITTGHVNFVEYCSFNPVTLLYHSHVYPVESTPLSFEPVSVSD